ncbi:hypothetical protein BDZ45DRAFT_745097 [Acephala macrosclerotiorum]|nr:hypothetical protein BDZ45DRAFT_745097 [Acephala macrosclerotiorum]
MSEINADVSPYCASRSRKVDVVFNKQARKLIAKGIIIDKVVQALAFKPRKEEGVSEAAQTSANFETFWRVIVPNRDQVELELEDFDTDLDDSSGFDDIFNHSENLSRLYHDSAVPDTTTSGFLKGLGAYIGSKRYIIMEKSMGLGPEGTREDDIVCVLLGCSVPVILRTSESNSGEFYLVGKAYVHGAMDREVIEKLDASYRELQALSII